MEQPAGLHLLGIEARKLDHPLLPPIDFNEKDGLSPEEAAVLAVLSNPLLRAVRDERALAAAQLLQAGLLPNPQFASGLDVPTGGATQGTVDGYSGEVNWEVTRLIPRGAYREAAARHQAAVDLEVAWAEWQVAQAAKTAVYRLMGLQAENASMREVVERLKENLDVIRKAFREELVTELKLAAAEAAYNQAQADELDSGKRLREQRLALNRLLGLPPESRVTLQKGLQLPSCVVPLPEARLSESIEERRLDLVALRRGYESEQATVRAAVLSRFPPINLGFTHARDTTDVVTTGLRVSIDLPIFDRNQGHVAIGEANERRLLDEYANRLFEARADVAKLLVDLDALNRQVAVARAAEPTLERLVETYRLAVNEGQADVLSYYTAWNNLSEKRIEILRLEEQLAEARTALELAAGLFRVDQVEASGAACPQWPDEGLP
jgi:cobalt-zinc-cadmium efflux system outer membrane protein